MEISVSTCATPRFRRDLVRAGSALLLLFGVLCAAGAAPSQAAGPTCPKIAEFNAANFSNPTTINNRLMPLTPGSQLVLDGTVVSEAGVPVPHRVVFTVTDLTKVINGVRTVVVWDVDRQGDQILEAELAFFAQDDAGNVWSLGEYPEEFANGAFIGAPSTWIAGIKDAQPGIHMTPAPVGSRTFFLQGFAPDIEFEDCARVARTARSICVAFGCFHGGVITEEKDIFDPAGGLQTKFYAPGVGIVRIGARGDPLAETLTAVEHNHLTGDALASARAEALKLDDRGYQFSDVYGQTAPVEGPGIVRAAPPPPPPAAQPAATSVLASVSTSRGRLTLASARSTVRRALRTRLRNWTITRVSCRRLGAGRVRCAFSAARRGARLQGSGTVTRQNSGRMRYRLTARITRNDCRPAASARCTRRTVWSP